MGETDIPTQNEVGKSESEDIVPEETPEKISEEVEVGIVLESDSKTEVSQVQPLEEKVSVKEAAETEKTPVETSEKVPETEVTVEESKSKVETKSEEKEKPDLTLENFSLERLDEYFDIEFLTERVFDSNNTYEDRKAIRSRVRKLKAQKNGTDTSAAKTAKPT